MRLPLLLLLLSVLACTACREVPSQTHETAAPDSLLPRRADFQGRIDSQETDLYILKHPSGIQVALTNYGGRVVSILVRDSLGRWTDVVQGFDNRKGFETSSEAYYGATIGRYGNRIAKGQFTLDGQTYTLATNNAPNHLHGGKKGFQYVVWQASEISDTTLTLTYRSPDGEEGYPGNLDVEVRFRVTAGPELRMEYKALTDKKTVINLTGHAFFNLNGAGSGSINGHLVRIPSEQFSPVDSTLIPLGPAAPVAGTPFDFRTPTAIGARLEVPDTQLRYGGGYDHNYLCNEGQTPQPHLSAEAWGERSGIHMQVWSTEPCIQFYGGNFMNGKENGKYGKALGYRTAFCMEPQHFPDSPNRPEYPTTVLLPGDTFRSVIAYRFGR